MSKHEKQVRRERKKTDRARRLMARFRHPTSHIPHGGAAALAAAAVIAAGTSAYASPVRFDNTAGGGHFDWFGGSSANPIGLNITLPAGDQTGIPFEPATFHQANDPSSGFVSGAGTDQVEAGGYAGLFLLPLNGGDLIPSGAAWNSFGYTYYAGFGSELPDGQAVYLGARFDIGQGNQYGWFGVVRDGVEVDAFAWGYETEVGVPIEAGIPEPGSLALLAFGALAVCRRRP